MEVVEIHPNNSVAKKVVYYTITSEGLIFSHFKNGNVKNVKPRTNGNGYLRVSIYGHDKYVHRLAAKGFIPNPHDYTEVNHKDGNKENNDVSNLEWCTRSMNNKHAFQTGLRDYSFLSEISNSEKAMAARKKRRKLTDEQVREIRKMLANGFTDREIAKKYKVSRGSIYGIRVGTAYAS